MNVLLVANHTLFRDGVKLLLQKSDFLIDVKEAPKLNDALKILAIEQFDIILLDIQLSDSVGLDSLREIKRLEKQTPVITINDAADSYLARQSIAYGASGHISKTSSYDELEKAISAAKTGSVYIAPETHDQLNSSSLPKNTASDGTAQISSKRMIRSLKLRSNKMNWGGKKVER